MTTFEHAMLGANGVMAAGLHRTHGWKLVALAGLAAIAPDWDGLTVLLSASLFDQGHRVWGHNVFACCLAGALLGFLDDRFDMSARVAGCFTRLESLSPYRKAAELRQHRTRRNGIIWILVGMLAALSQIPADALVSGGQGLGDWPVQLFWPLSDTGFVYPMVPWGDPGISIVFCIGMITAARLPHRLQIIAGATLLCVAGYIVIRGTV